ncbi:MULTISPECIES: glycosyltransferase family 2 protein [unclassified Bacillus cereus group]|uniref:glycosyltransferase family 2 protein n=1 Tax=unclassified Bacillus cereus group TaxID=2750818 RepID=UPI001F582CC8|nr:MULTISPECIES: glycosyltransferase family 2 protein [unclassified Bacillus cereus group]
MKPLMFIKKKIALFIRKPILPTERLRYRKIVDDKFYEAKNHSLKYLYDKQEEKQWKNAFYKMLCANKNGHEILCAFTDNQVELVNASLREDEGPILISIVKNEKKRIPTFFKHYRDMGIKHFAILDNDSNDGTREWLCLQDDCDVFYTSETYSTQKREAWVNRLLSHYGHNRWYLVVDSDEHFVYPGMESQNINEFISSIKEKGYERVRSLMLDMYPKDNINFITNEKDEDYTAQYSYFDKSSYKVTKEHFGILVSGGPRKRIFDLDVYLTKHPLFYFNTGDIQGHSHYQYPYQKNKNLPCFTALLHYKFLNSDISKYEQRVKVGNFYNGSEEYKQYLKRFNNRDDFSFFYDGSIKYQNSDSLFEIEVIEKNY